MHRTAIPTFILFLALAGCGGESRIESTEGDSAGEEAERAEPAPRPKKSPPKPSRAEASADPKVGKTASAPAAGDAAAKDSPASPSTPARPVAKTTARPIPSDVAAIIADLKRDAASARSAFLKIWEIPPSVIPRLIDQVENTETSQLETLQILVMDPDFLRPGEVKPFLANRIHGLGRMEVLDETNQDDIRLISQDYTKMSYGITPNKHYKVVLERFGGFSIGVVVRAGLINRLRSTHYPPSSDDEPGPGKLIAWWRDFYGLAKADLEAATR